MSSFIVVYDANVLYPSMLRNLLVRVAQEGLVQAKWTERILDEAFGNLKENRPELDSAKIDKQRALINSMVRDCIIEDYEPLIPCLALPDEKDRHVLAAAIKSRAQVIVTSNLQDFPEESLQPWQVEAMSADDFVRDLIDLHEPEVRRILEVMSQSFKRPPLSPDEILDRLVALSPPMTESVAALRGTGA